MRPSVWTDVPHRCWVLSPTSKQNPRTLKIGRTIPYRHVTFPIGRHASTSTWTEDEKKRIYIQGFGNLSKFLSHSFMQLDNRPPVTVLVSDNERVRRFAQNQGRVEIITDGVSSIANGFEIQVAAGKYVRARKVGAGQKIFTLRTLALGPDQQITSGEELEHPEPEEMDNGGLGKGVEGLPKLDIGLTGSAKDPSIKDLSKPKFKIVKSKPTQKKKEDNFPRLRVTDREEAVKGGTPIKNLIVTNRPNQVIDVLERLKHRLRKDSTILFIQTGMGILEEVNEKIFTDPKTRPTYLIGLTSHALWEDQISPTESGDPMTALANPVIFRNRKELNPERPYVAKRLPVGSLLIGPAVHVVGQETLEQAERRDQTTKYLVNTILGCTPLNARQVDRESILFYRLKKTVINSVILPMTVLFGCYNGDIIKGDERRALARTLLQEAVNVLGPENFRLTYEYLEAELGKVLQTTASSVSPMLSSVAMGRESAIDYINGYIVKRGRELGIPCPKHEQVVRFVKTETEERAIYVQDCINEIRQKELEEKRERDREAQELKRASLQEHKAKRKAVKKEREAKQQEAKKSYLERPAITALGNAALRNFRTDQGIKILKYPSTNPKDEGLKSMKVTPKIRDHEETINEPGQGFTVRKEIS